MSKRLLYALGCLAILTLLLSACQPSPAGVSGTVPPAPTATPDGQGITLYYVGKSAQVELTSPQGIRVLIDVAYPGFLSSPPTADDILLTTHRHGDHQNAGFVGSFPGQQLTIEEGEITVGDVTIHSIMASHAVSNFGAVSACDNAIFIIDMGGLRIVHFGDFGEGQLTQEQLAALGDVDVAISMLGDARTFRQLLTDRTMFSLMAQLNPRLIIPTDHKDSESIGYAAQQWQGFYSSDNPVTIEPADLTDETRFLVLGDLALSYHMIFGLPLWEGSAAGR
jgi:hypothetical protein